MLTFHRTSTAAALVFAAAALSLGTVKPAAAQTPCAKWEVFGRWTAIQGNYRVDFHLNQQGANVYGIGAVDSPNKSVFSTGPFEAATEGRVTGTVRGNAVELQTTWGGVYVGTIDATGRIDGFTYDRRDSTSNAGWFSNRRMKCVAEAGSAPPAPAVTRPAPPSAPTQGSDTVPGSRGAASASLFRAGSASIPAPVPTPAFSEGRSIYCKPGFVWRVARPADLVCVTPRSRDRVAYENATAAKRIEPKGGAYGPSTCRSGYVWREAFVGDLVCVHPKIRDLVRKENSLAATRVN